MKEKFIKSRFKSQTMGWIIGAIAIISVLLLYKLSSLTHGFSATELQTSHTVLGWHGLYSSIFYAPLTILQSIIFYISPGHGYFLTRLPSTIFGALTMLSFGWVLWLWHGKRTAILATPLFITSAWVLHISRFASYDIMYLWAITTLMLTHTLLQKYENNIFAWIGTVAFWGILITIPGMIWFLIAEIFLQRKIIAGNIKSIPSFWMLLPSILLFIVWIPLVIVSVSHPHTLITWLGLPEHFDPPLTILKHFFGVFVHLFIRGPEYPQIWLGRSPILDVFTLTVCGLGIYFYASRWDSSRSRLLAVMFIIGVILVTLNGPVGLSVLVPLLYCIAAMGIAYFMHEWLRVFPINPIARGLGIALMGIVITMSCLYNLRAYFVAWPHNPDTKATFIYLK
jgi:hypothetical protein